MRRIPLSRRSHVTGFGTASGAVVPHESALERDFALRVSFLDAGAVITSQPVTISFSHDDRQRRYTPDFHVRWSDGRGELVEIKYRADLRNACARKAAIRSTKMRSSPRSTGCAASPRRLSPRRKPCGGNENAGCKPPRQSTLNPLPKSPPNPIPRRSNRCPKTSGCSPTWRNGCE